MQKLEQTGTEGGNVHINKNLQLPYIDWIINNLGNPILTTDLVQGIMKSQGKKATVESSPATIAANAGNKENPIYVVIEEGND